MPTSSLEHIFQSKSIDSAYSRPPSLNINLFYLLCVYIYLVLCSMHVPAYALNYNDLRIYRRHAKNTYGIQTYSSYIAPHRLKARTMRDVDGLYVRYRLVTSCLCNPFKLQTGHCLGWKDFDRFHRCYTR